MVASALLLLVALHTPPPRATTPADVVRQVVTALEHDSAQVLATRYRARLARDSSDRAARFGLATVARFTYDTIASASAYARLIPSASGTAGDRWTVWALLGQAQQLHDRSRIGDAATAYERALQAAHAHRDRDAEGEALLGLASMRYAQHRMPGGDSLFERVRVLLPSTDLRMHAAYWCGRGQLSALTGKSDGGAEIARGLRYARQARDLRMAAHCLHAWAIDRTRVGDLDGASRALHEAEALLRRAKERAGLAAILQWHGYAEREQGRYGSALVLLRESAVEAQASNNLGALAWTWLNLGSVSLSIGDLPSAWSYAAPARTLLTQLQQREGVIAALGLQSDIAMARGRGAESRALLDTSIALSGGVAEPDVERQLADLALRDGDFAGATKHLDNERELLRQSGGTRWIDGLNYYYAVIALRRNDVAGAERDLQADLAQLDSSQHERRYFTQVRLADLAVRRGDTAAAAALVHDASAALDRWRGTLDDAALRLLAFQVQDDFGGEPVPIARVLGAIAASGRAQTAFDLAERRRARELNDELRRGAALRTFDASIARAVGATSDRTPLPSLEPNTALIEYLAGRGPQPTTAFVVTASGIRAIRVAPIDAIAPDVARLASFVEDGADATAIQRRLGAQLLEPVLATLPSSITRLVIVPDDVLHHVPFQALITRNGRFVVDDFAVTTVPSAAVLEALQRRRSNASGVLVLANPTLGASDTLPPLPGAARESEIVRRYAPRAVVQTGSAASEAFLKRAPLERYRVIHFATHAIVDESSVARTVLVLAPGDGEDGHMGPGDLSALHLDADLIVLSACRTAAGWVVGGEGIRGLTAPLLQAGARAVVATSWDVGDRSAGTAVEALYRTLALNLPADEALRRAEAELRRQGAAVRDWAAFTIVGDGGVRPPLREPLAAH